MFAFTQHALLNLTNS